MAGSLDGSISVHEYKNDNWYSFSFFAHGFGVNSIAFGTTVGSDSNSFNTTPLRFVSCGNDNLIKIWESIENKNESFFLSATLEAHGDVVTCVDWRKNDNLNSDIIASGGAVSIIF